MISDEQFRTFVATYTVCLQMYTDATSAKAYLEGADVGIPELDQIPVPNRYIRVKCRDIGEERAYERLYSRVLTADQCAHVIFLELWR